MVESKMDSGLLQVILGFQTDVVRAVELLSSTLGTSDRRKQVLLVRERGGYLEKERQHRCNFHGVGCRLQLSPNRFVDWDYGHDGRIDGFDLWRLTTFLKTRRKLHRVSPPERLEEAFQHAVESGEICRHPKDPQYGLYYLTKTLNERGDA